MGESIHWATENLLSKNSFISKNFLSRKGHLGLNCIMLSKVSNTIFLCSSRKYPYTPHRRDWNFLGVGGFVRPKNLKKCMKLNWNFQRGEGEKSLLWGKCWYFLELHIYLLTCQILFSISVEDFVPIRTPSLTCILDI